MLLLHSAFSLLHSGVGNRPIRCRAGLIAVLTATVLSGWAAAPPPSPLIPPIAAGPNDGFADVSARAGLDFVHQFCHDRIANILLSNGAGGAVLDYDRDGWVDIFLVNWGPLAGVTSSKYTQPREPNRLYRNRGDGTFEDVTQRAGLAGSGFASAAAAGDFDNDGYPDLYVVNFGANLLYRNRGDGTFEEVTARAGVGDTGTGISAVWLDADRDGRLDLFVANYLTFDPSTVSEQNPGAYPGPLAYPGEANVLYRNRGDGTFEDVTKAAGLYAPGHRAMSVSAFDADWDGDTDLYVSNDDTPNALWLNDGQGRFRDVALASGVAFNSIGEAPGSMNAAVGDLNGNGLMDIFVTRLGYGSLYLRHPKGFYEDRMYASGLGRITQPYVGWGGVQLDFDNDGDRDLFVTNGDAFTLPGTLSLLLENDGQARFTDAAARGGAFFRHPVNGRGSATLDFDNDGRVDLLITPLANRVILLRNQDRSANRWLTVELEGTRSNRDAYGALLTVTAGGRVWKAEATCSTGFLFQSDKRVHFGLGPASRVERLEVRWPSGRVQTWTDLDVNRILQLREPTD
ncbi:MAG: CRTAC1 family protein [Verrucomicrobiales bacterium]|nr:CRTAC1 family protein [Verrucomicrobiales bacterium]